MAVRAKPSRLAAAFAIVALGLMASSPVCAKITAAIGSNLGGDATRRNVRGCQQAQDSLTLFVHDNGRLLVAQDYCSSYGHSDVEIFEDAKGVSYLVLRYGDGHGTSAVSEHIAVLRVGSGLALCSRQLVEQAAGLSSTWEYRHEIERPSGGGLRLHLTRTIYGSDAEDYPRDKTKTIDIDTPGRACTGRDLKRQRLTGDGYGEYPSGDDDYIAAPRPLHPLGRLDPKKR